MLIAVSDGERGGSLPGKVRTSGPDAARSAFSCLLSPLRIGPLLLPNRVLMGSMHMGLEGTAEGHQRLAAFYEERARAGVGLIVTGAVSVNLEGRLNAHEQFLETEEQALAHRVITDRVHEAGGRICLQLIHSGRYGMHDATVAPSPIRSPISPRIPRELSAEEVERCIADFVKAATLARLAGYDGVEIMGAEGYLINEFLCERTNQRSDGWGGSAGNRRRFPREIVLRTREALGSGFLVGYRISVLDLVEGGQTAGEVIDLARELQECGVHYLSSGVGWHEARIPTIAQAVPRAAWAWATARVKRAVDVPVAAAVRINSPDDAEGLLREGVADLIAMARPFLADPEFVLKTVQGRTDEINGCIACNQACLDFYFGSPPQPATCLVNPRAGRETEWPVTSAKRPRRLAVVGAGPAGLSCALTAAERGHAVTLYEASARIGGQLNLAIRIPGKDEFGETLRYFHTRLVKLGVQIFLERSPTAEELLAGGYDGIVIATGVLPRHPGIEGVDHSKVLSYLDVLEGRREVGARVAIVGAGGIGFDVAMFLSGERERRGADKVKTFLQEWSVDSDPASPGGLRAFAAHRDEGRRREVFLLQRSAGKLGRTLGRTTGWILKSELAARGVHMLAGVDYQRIDDRGLHIVHDGAQAVLDVDNVVLCAGQESNRSLYERLIAMTNLRVECIGGAKLTAGIDARRAIEEGMRVAIEF